MKKKCLYIILVTTLSFIGCSRETPQVDIYQSKEYNSLTEKDMIIGESIWATSCFRCHRYGTNGAISIEDEKYWNHTASKGIDALFKSVWQGKQNEKGIMPAKGFCNTCSEDDIKKSIFFILHLAKQNPKNNQAQ